MDSTTKVLISGYGSMGQIIRKLVDDKPGWKATIGFDIKRSDAPDFPVVSSTYSITKIYTWKPDIIIDYSSPSATESILELAKEHRIPIYIGTTCIGDIIQKNIKTASAYIPIFFDNKNIIVVSNENRMLYAELAIKAAEFLLTAKPGLYNTKDLII